MIQNCKGRVRSVAVKMHIFERLFKCFSLCLRNASGENFSLIRPHLGKKVPKNTPKEPLLNRYTKFQNFKLDNYK